MPRIRTSRIRRAKWTLTALGSIAALGWLYWGFAPLPWRPTFVIERPTWGLLCTPEYLIVSRLRVTVLAPGKTVADFDPARMGGDHMLVGPSGAVAADAKSVPFSRERHEHLLTFTPEMRSVGLTSDGFQYSFKNTYVRIEALALAGFLLALLPSAWLWWRDRPFPAGCCTRCGYDLHGGVLPVCPECAAPVTEREPVDVGSE